MIDTALVQRLRSAIDPERLLATAVALMEVPSPTGDGAAVADRLGQVLAGDGFKVERPIAGWPKAPAVAARLDSGAPGRCLQFNGHLDTVHLPFVPPRVEDGVLHGTGAADMKGGIAAMCEALRALRDTGALGRGRVLLTAHELHEFPWGDGRQVNGLIDEGFLGDAVLLPEYLCDCLPVAGRGLAVLEATVSRDGQPVHEVLGGIDQPSVIAAGAELIQRLAGLDRRLAEAAHPLAGRASVFVGKVHAGEIFNQSPTELHLAGTRRWLPGSDPKAVERELRGLVADTAAATKTRIDLRWLMVRDAFELTDGNPLVGPFQEAYQAVAGRALPIGAKPFVDDGNAFASRGKVPAITHGPSARGAHTTEEFVPLAELARVALVYALTAVVFCHA